MKDAWLVWALRFCLLVMLWPCGLPRVNGSMSFDKHAYPRERYDSSQLTVLMFESPRHDWYQTESQVIVTVMAKNVPKDGVCVNFTERELSAKIQMASGEDCNLHFHLLHPIVPQQSSFKILTTKVELSG
ncbi:hypothetical protein GOODEAATRI_026524 [Goodea atripinnis]|uniref:CS domain-containing protein n=1 Tax=Goodea atripinnis TaxID=208336 RepID=A0ABV0MXE5_9TELE